MSTSEIVYIDGRDITDLGLRALSLADWWSGPRYRRGSALPYGMMGALPASEATVDPRRIPLGFATDAAYASRVSALDIVRYAEQGLLEISVGDDPDRVAYGLLEGDTTRGLLGDTNVALHGDLGHTWDLVCYDVAKYDRLGSVVGFGATRTEIPLGTAASGGYVYIHGAATNPVLRYRSMSGEIQGSMTFTVTLTSSEALEIDLISQAVTKISSGTRTDGLSLWTAGDFFGLDPADADGEGEVWPTLEVSAGNGELRYRRRWLS